MTVFGSSDLVGRRRLIAVVYADMVGYSRLIEVDDLGTLDRLRTLRRALIDPAIKEHGGTLVQTGGDSLLIMFDSIDGAMRCAVTMQQRLPEYDSGQPADRAIRFRVGVNIGDAIADGTDLHGDGVNVAARLQAECPPGQICVSRAVRDHMQGRLDLNFEELGTLNLKNISRPVEGFLLNVGGDTATSPRAADRPLLQSDSKASRLPDKPTIAVLAFTNMSGDPDQEYFSDGIADDIITELSRSRSMFVIARNSSFTYKSRAVDVKQLAMELGAKYVVEGSVRRAGRRVRISAQLINAETGHHLWAERYDRDDTELFVVQDEITTAVTAAILPAVADAELRRILRRPPESLGAWEAYQRGLWHEARYNAAENERAIELFHRAIAQDEMFVDAYVALVVAYFESGQAHGTRPYDEAIKMAGIWAQKAVEIDAQNAAVQTALGSVAQLAGRRDEAWECASLAIAISPNLPSANALKGSLLIYNGQPSQGRNAMLFALRLSPHDPRSIVRFNQIAISYYLEGDYVSAVEATRRTIARYPIARYPDNPSPYRWLAAALGQLGQIEEARETLQMVMSTAPKAFDLFVRNRAWLRPEDYEHLLDGLRKAGWQLSP